MGSSSLLSRMAPADTPLMRQWREAKADHVDSLLFFRVGDFYELFHDDAEEGARLLGLTLTSRNNGAAAGVPLAGIPAKALDEYLSKLVRLGRRVAICDQVEDPAEAKGIVRREVTEMITPGTVLADSLLMKHRNNFLVALVDAGTDSFGMAVLDVSTGEMSAQLVPASELRAELGRLEPSELLLPYSLETSDQLTWAAGPSIARTLRADWMFDADLSTDALLSSFGVHSLDGFGFQSEDQSLVRVSGALVQYLKEIRPGGVSHLKPPRIRRPGQVMLLDEMTRRNLELIEPLRTGEQGGVLLDVLDVTTTPMGGRLLRRWVLEPLIHIEDICVRHSAVEEFVDRPDVRKRIRGALSGITDFERLAGKVGTGRVTPRDLAGLRRSLEQLPEIQAAGIEAKDSLIRECAVDKDCLEDVSTLLKRAISDDPPATLQEGGVVKKGWSEDLDELRAVRDGARDFIASLQVRERERTGVASLKVGFNKVFGYYLEVTRANLGKVPVDYVRKQTLANAERYFTPELKEWEEKVFGAEDRISHLEAELFSDIRGRIAKEIGRLQDTAARVATLDVLVSFAEVATSQNYVRPEIHSGFELELVASRHPVVETMMPREKFIPNDICLNENGWIVVLTGPNMAGKSTVLRQVGLIQLLAQIGSFVPADQARIPVADRIFTRVGASDNLARGQSTFMVEMSETAAIVHGATEMSLVLLDEIGRGTSTYDGVSIAWSVTEYLHEELGSKTIFATHYHELTQLGDLLPGVKNMNVLVREVGSDIVFLRRLLEGGADRSYGIQVARLAGLPDTVVARAQELLVELEGTHTGGGEGLGRYGIHRPGSETVPDQLSMFRTDHPALIRLRGLAPDDLTPRDALELLYQLRAAVHEDENTE